MYYADKTRDFAFNDVNGGEATACVQSIVDKYIKTGNYVYELNGQLADANGCFSDLLELLLEAAAGEKTAEIRLGRFPNTILC